MGDPDSFTSTPLCSALLGFGTDESASELKEMCMICAEREREGEGGKGDGCIAACAGDHHPGIVLHR
jgi:hypothetical protein